MKNVVYDNDHWRDLREKDRAALLDFFSRIHSDQRHRGQDSLSPLRALDRMLRGSRAGCASLFFASLSSENGQVAQADMESAFSSAFEMLTHCVRAAQRTGQLMGGDPTRIASLLLCVAIGGMQRMREPVGRQDEEALPVVLLRLLACRRSYSDQARSMNHKLTVSERGHRRQTATPRPTKLRSADSGEQVVSQSGPTRVASGRSGVRAKARHSTGSAK